MATSYAGSPVALLPGSRTFPVLEVHHPSRPEASFEAVSVLSFAFVAEIAVSSRAFLPNARLSPVDNAAVDELREPFERVQRVLAGQKKSNTNGELYRYILDRALDLDDDGFPKGWLPSSVLYFPARLEVVDGQAVVPPGVRAILFDGDSRHESKLRALDESTDPTFRARLMALESAYQILHGVPGKKARPWFADVNGRGIKVNANLLMGREEEDVFARVSRAVFERHGVPLELEKRQAAPSSDKILTALQARTFAAAMVLGVNRAVQAGARVLPQDVIAPEELEDALDEYLGVLLNRFSPELFKDRELVLRSTPVLASLGALGRPWLENDKKGKQATLRILRDKRIDWGTGEHWAGLAGKINPVTGVFSVGGGKEYAHQTWRALNAKDTPAWEKLRDLGGTPDAPRR